MHWYYDGKLFDKDHELWGRLEDWPLKKDGTPRARINDRLRLEMGVVPSVTTILLAIQGDKIAPLMNWAGGLGIKAARSYSTDDAAKKKFRQLREEDAERGTKFHNGIQRYRETGFVMDDPAIQTACENVEGWMTEHGILDGRKEFVVEGDGYAGTVDHAVDRGMDGVIVDFKTVRNDDGRDTYVSECAQCSAYYQALWPYKLYSEPTEMSCCNLYISRETGVITHEQWWTAEQLNAGWELFLLAKQTFTKLVEFGGLK